MKELVIQNVSMGYETSQGYIEILHDINLYIDKGESIAIVGESGCGKSQLMRTILHLNREKRRLRGKIYWKDNDITLWNQQQMKQLRHHKIAMIFQDPKMALDPTYTIGKQMMECISYTKKKHEKREICEQALAQVHIADSKRIMKSYPHQLSIGMCQRVMIAMLILSGASLWICDEATSSLDVSIQADLLQLIQSLRNEYGASMIFITHDLRLVPSMSERVYIMKQGCIVETCTSSSLFQGSHHPATNELIHAITQRNPNLIHKQQ